MKIFSTNKKDDKDGFYRIIQPLRFLKRSGWEARTVPFTGSGSVSVLPVDNSLLVMLSKDSDFIFTTPVFDGNELLRILDLRKHNNSRWIVDLSENIYANENIKDFLPIIERSLMLADGVVVSNEKVKYIAKTLNENIYVLPSALDFEIWDNLENKPKGLRIGYIGFKEDLEIASPALKELVKKYKLKFINLDTDEVIEAPKLISKQGLSIVIFPQADNNYNRCKNNIDLLEIMALKIPIVASPVEAFKDLPVFYAKTNYEWYEKLENLIKDKSLREEIGGYGYEFVRKHYDMSHLVGNFQRWLKKLPRKDY